MKKWFLALILTMILALPIQLQAAGTVTQTLRYTHNFYALTYSFTSDASGNADQESTWPIDGYVCKVITNPGATAPSVDWDVTLTNSDGIDVVHGQLADRHTSTSQEIIPVPSDNVTVYGCSAVSGKITLNVSNAGDSKIGTVTVLFTREGY